ncbi:MAG: response regulator [Salibacteraceae bacterium]
MFETSATTETSELASIWLIDDDPVNNFICSRLITEAVAPDDLGVYEKADDGLTQLRVALQNPEASLPDLIFLDLDMPVTSGWDFLEEYRQFGAALPKSPVLCILSSSVYEGDLEKAKDYPEVVRFFSKPLTVENLSEIQNRFFPAA